MSDYKDKFNAWTKKATDKLGEIDSQLGLKEKIEDGAKTLVDAAKTGAGYVKQEANKSELGRKAVDLAETAIDTATDAAQKAWDASEPVRDAAVDAGMRTGGAVVDVAERAGGIAADTFTTVGAGAKHASRVVGFGASLASTLDAAISSAKKAAAWAADDPVKAATTGVSMAIGAGLGVVFTGLSSHWLMNSAIPTLTVKELAVRFDGYLKRREELIKKGALNQADAERIQFERDLAKRVGAPLLGAFAFASGAVMMTNVLDPSNITGFPIGSIIGGSPLLEGIWFFGNGMVCIKTSYDLFMIALDGDEDVERMVKEIKGLLPQTS
ncbi:MAG: hypothetical protein HS105_12250 [Chloracidobacterium sp.]|nr:hypothetical protein [Chloracidobacterium sp.]MCC6825761.1 hypothetical protein [Acidobacteriota bacterium]MCO5332915.1 hypothetical protein [Pyrinomonadaceae bacterium]